MMFEALLLLHQQTHLPSKFCVLGADWRLQFCAAGRFKKCFINGVPLTPISRECCAKHVGTHRSFLIIDLK